MPEASPPVRIPEEDEDEEVSQPAGSTDAASAGGKKPVKTKRRNSVIDTLRSTFTRSSPKESGEAESSHAGDSSEEPSPLASARNPIRRSADSEPEGKRVSIRRSSILVASAAAMIRKSKADGTDRRESIRQAQRRTSQFNTMAEAAGAESQEAKDRAYVAMRAAAMARAAATRQAWEVRTLRFLADGNAVLTDGTEIKIWVAVQQEIAEAETKGVPLSDQARAALLRMNTAEKAIKAASNAAKRAAEKAIAELEQTKEGRKAMRMSNVTEFPDDAAGVSARAEQLAREASVLVAESLQKQKAKEIAEEKLRIAREQERQVRWGLLPQSFSRRSRRSRETRASTGEDSYTAGDIFYFLFCSCWPSRSRRVLPPMSPSEVEFQRQRVASPPGPSSKREPKVAPAVTIVEKPPLVAKVASTVRDGSPPTPRVPSRLPPLDKSPPPPRSPKSPLPGEGEQ